MSELLVLVYAIGAVATFFWVGNMSEPELQMLHRCFDTWRGIGDSVAGIARQEYDLELRRYDGHG